MKILKRSVLTRSSAEEAARILKTCANDPAGFRFTDSLYSMDCTTRRTGEFLSRACVTGRVYGDPGAAAVDIEIHGDPAFSFGEALLLLGFIALLYSLVFSRAGWFLYLGLMVIGLFPMAQTLCRGTELLDIIEHKLTRVTE